MKDVYTIIQFLTIPIYDELTGKETPVPSEVLENAITILEVNIGAKRNEVEGLEKLKEHLQARKENQNSS